MNDFFKREADMSAEQLSEYFLNFYIYSLIIYYLKESQLNLV